MLDTQWNMAYSQQNFFWLVNLHKYFIQLNLNFVCFFFFLQRRIFPKVRDAENQGKAQTIVKPVLESINELIMVQSTLNKIDSASVEGSGELQLPEELIATKSLLSATLREVCEWVRNQGILQIRLEIIFKMHFCHLLNAGGKNF